MLVKNGMDSSFSNSGDMDTLPRAAQIHHLSSSCGKGTAKTLLQSLKKNPSKSYKKTYFE